MSESAPADDLGVVSRQRILDLSHLTSPDQLKVIGRIEHVGVVVVPESLAGGYVSIPSSYVGGTIHVPDGANVRAHTGPLTLSGDGLGAATDVLVVVGLLVINTPVTGTVPRQISVLGAVIAPTGSERLLGPALAGGTGSVGYYRYVAGQDVKVLTGQVRLSGISLANASGQPDDVLIAAGQVVVTGPVPDVGYQQIFIAGQFVAPAASQKMLEPRLQVQGQMVWYTSDTPRVFYEDTTLSSDFFRLLDRPVSLIPLADLTIAPGVTEDALLAKAKEFVLLGDLIAPAELMPVLQVLTTYQLGAIRTDDGSGR